MNEAVRVIDPVEDPLWVDLAREHGSLFSSPPWLGALRDTYGFEIEAWVVERDGAATGGIPVIPLGEGAWARMSVLPFSDYCDLIDVDGTAWPVLSEALLGCGSPVELRCLGEHPAVGDDRFQLAGAPDLWHGVRLEADEELAWSALPGSARRAIRKARESGIEVRATDDLVSLRAFFELHLRTRKNKYRLLAQPHEFFTCLHKRFGEDMALLGAWQGETLVAGILLLVWEDVLYYKFNASSPAALEVRPNDLLMWEATRLGVSRGLRLLDLGRTDGDHESLARYKSKYASDVRSITTLRHGDFRRDPMVGAILGPMTELLTGPNVPDEVTEEAGAMVYRHFA